MFPRYLQYLLMDFCQTFVTGAPRHRDELIRFWGQKVKVQGHTIAAEARSTRRYSTQRYRYRRVQLFLVCYDLFCILCCQVLHALDRYHDDRAMAFMSVLHSLVVSIATWHNDSPDGKSPVSSESATIHKPCRPSCEAIRAFLQEYKHQKELTERLMDVDDGDIDEVNDEMKDSEAGKTAAAADDGNNDDANMMCEDDLRQEPPDHIKLVMEVRISRLLIFCIKVQTSVRYS